MRLFGTAALAVVAMAASHCAAQASEQAPIQLSRAETQNESLRERRLNRRNKRRHNRKKNHHKKATHTEGTPIPEEFVKETRQQQPTCSVCGEGMEVGNPDASVSFPGQSGQIPCDILQNMGIVGLIPPLQCEVLPSLISTVCECEAIETTTTSTVISTTEAKKPSKATGKSSKSEQMSISMPGPVPSKTGKSATDEPIITPSGGKSSKVVFSAPPSSGSMLVASKASGKSEKSASKNSKNGKATIDAKAEKVTSSSKTAKAVVSKTGKSASY